MALNTLFYNFELVLKCGYNHELINNVTIHLKSAAFISNMSSTEQTVHFITAEVLQQQTVTEDKIKVTNLKMLRSRAVTQF